MIKPTKLYAQLLTSRSRTLPFRDFERLLRAFGFEHDRTRGSHQVWTHPAINLPLSIQPSDKDAKRYQIEQFLELVEQHGLYMSE
jgi:predicted RNA binding protein YcfA (HicA-like mRNA interferase family)